MKSLWLAFFIGLTCLICTAYALTSPPVNVPITITTVVTPTATLSASPNPIASGSSSTLAWGSTNATSCAGTGFSTGNATSGSVSTGALTVTTSYSVTCSGSNPASVTVTVTGGGGSVACDVGPNAPGIPAPAVAAGFNTCVLNMDFTSNTTDANGINWNNPNTWNTSCGAVPSAANHYNIMDVQFLQVPTSVNNTNVPYNAGVQQPCGDSPIITDSLDGLNSWDFRWLTSYWTPDPRGIAWTGTGYSYVYASWPGAINGYYCGSLPCAGGPNHVGYYPTYYVEFDIRTPLTTWRQSSNSNCDGNFCDGIVIDFWTNSCTAPSNPVSSAGCNTGIPGYPNNVTFAGGEIDFFETHSAWFDYTTHQLQLGEGTTNYFVPDIVGSYHRMGYLLTNNGTLQVWCAYIDAGVDSVNPAPSGGGNSPSGRCTSQTAGNSPGYFLDLNNIPGCWDQTSPTLLPGNWYGPPNCIQNNNEIFIRYIRVFSCSNYWNRQCTGAGFPLMGAVDQPTKYAWLQRSTKYVRDLFIHPAAAEPLPRNTDPMGPPLMGRWECPAGQQPAQDMHDRCRPPELGDVWWDHCVPGRDDCVHSDTAFLGWKFGRIPQRGPGYCYTGQPATCSANPK
jgi:hypothetical protein